MHYLPILFIDQLSSRVKDLMVRGTLAWLPKLLGCVHRGVRMSELAPTG